MAIAYDNKTAYSYSATRTVTQNHTCSGTDRIVFVHATGGSSAASFSSVTYDGVTMTEAGTSLDNVSGGSRTGLFYLINPPTGAKTVSVTTTGGNTGVVCSTVSYTGVHQTNPINVTLTEATNATTASYTRTVTTDVDNCWILSTFRTGSGNALTAGADTTVRNQPEVVAFGAGSIIDSNATRTAGSNSLNVTCTSQFFGGSVTVGIRPAGTIVFKKATVNPTYVTATLTNYPTYVDLSRLGVTTLAEAKSVRVYSDLAKTTELAREIVSVTEMHTKIASLISTPTATSIYVEWDGTNSDYAVGATYGRNAVWSDYRAVYHSETLTEDSTANGYTLTNNNTVGTTTGKIAGAGDAGTTNTNKYLSISNDIGITNGNITASIWVKMNTEISTGGQTFYEKGDSGTNVQYRIGYEYNGGTRRIVATRLRQNVVGNDAYTTQTMGTSSFYHIVLTYDGTTVRTYVNGAAGGTVASSGDGASAGVDVHYLYAQRSGGTVTAYASADIDEARTTSSVRDSNWIGTEYNNQNDEASFWGTWSDALLLTVSVSDTIAISESVTAGIALSKIETFSDDFNDNSIDSGKWTNWGGAEVTETSQQLNILVNSGGANYQGMDPAAYYDFTNSFVIGELVNAGNQSLTSLEVEFTVTDNGGNNQLFFLVSGNNLAAYKKVSGTTSYITNTPYSSVNQRYLRLRETSGTSYWEYSANRTSWTTLHSETTPISVIALGVALIAGVYNSEASSTTIVFDNINTDVLTASVNDAIAITENTSSERTTFVDTNEGMTVSESVTVTTGDVNRTVSVSDTITIVDKGHAKKSLSTIYSYGYYPVYRIGNPAIANIPWEKLSHVAYFNISPSTTGTINSNGGNGDTLTDMAALVSAAHTANKRITIVLGGAGAAPDTTWRSAISDTYRSAFVTNLVTFINDNNLDGVDLDWEPYDTSSDAANYILFISALRDALGGGKDITMFLAIQPSWKRTFANDVQHYIDTFNLSTYDLSYGQTSTMHDSPLYSGGGQPSGASAHDAVTNFLAAGVAANKLSISMSQYTAQWTGSTGLYTAGTFNPGNAEQYDGLAGATSTTPPTGETYDSTAKGAYIYSAGIFKSYNNIATVQAKVDYIIANGLAGIGIWEIGQAYFSGTGPNNPLLGPLDAEINPSLTVDVSDTITIFDVATTYIQISSSASYGSGSYDATHTISGFNCSGTQSHLMVAGFQRNPAVEVTGTTADGNTMTRYAASINANVAGVEWFSYTINNSSFNIVASTPSFKLMALGALGLNNINQDNPIAGTPVTAGGYSTTATASYTGTAGNLLLVAINCQNTRTLTASGCTQELNFDHVDANLGQCFVGYITATGSAQTIGATLSSTDNWQLSIIELLVDTGTSSDLITITESVTAIMDEGITWDLVSITESVTALRSGGTLSISFTTTDDLESRVIVELGRFRTWAGSTPRLWLGEFGVPNDRASGEQADWNRILEIAVDKCICDNIAFTYWASGHEWGTTYNLSSYESDTGNPGGTWSNTAIGATLDTALAKAEGQIPFVGVDYAGHEFGWDEQDPAAAPSRSDFQYHYNKGVKVIRYALGEPSWSSDWMYIPTTDSWRDNDIQYVENVMNNAALENVKIILDILHPGGGAKYATIGGASITNATNYNYYIAYATKLLNHSFTDHLGNTVLLKDHSALYGVDMVNEPQTCGSGSGNAWLTISQNLVNDFRDNAKINYNGTLFVALPHYSGIQDINNNAPSGPWISDPDNNFYYAGHLYPESNHVGNFTGTYADNVTSSSSFSGQGNFSCSINLANESLQDDSITITENVTLEIAGQAQVDTNEIISIQESVTVDAPGLFQTSVSDSITIDESQTLDAPGLFQTSVFDALVIEEFSRVDNLEIIASESLSIQESVQAARFLTGAPTQLPNRRYKGSIKRVNMKYGGSI